MSSTAPARPRSRLVEIDGLRGIAALVVVIHHSLLTLPPLAAAYYSEPVTGALANLLVRSPLHAVWDGTAAVLLFFILSGIALFRAGSGPAFTWRGYYSSRLPRLYLPVLPAIGWGWVLITLVPRHSEGLSAWLQARPRDYPIAGIIQDAILVAGTSRRISPLWSLQWEVIFSMALIVYVLVARRLRPPILVAVCILASAVGSGLGIPALSYLPIFGVGVAMGCDWDPIIEVGRRLFLKRWRAVAAVAVAIVASTSPWTLSWFVPIEDSRGATQPLVLAGLALAVVIGCSWEPAQRALRSPVARGLGTVSFSTYLVHEPIVIAVGEITRGAVWGVPVAILLSLIVGVGFYWGVERHAHALARAINVRVSRAGRKPGPNSNSTAVDTR